MAFTKSQLNECEHVFKQQMLRYFGEIWNPKSDAEYKGKAWDCKSMLSMDLGVWYLLQQVKHTGSLRCFGKIEVRDAGETVRFIAFYDLENVDDEKRIIT